MSGTIECARHGQAEKAYVCVHLLGESTALGFNRDEPTGDNRFPDAWCDDCEIVRVSHGGWTDEAQLLVMISLLCAGCYERSRIRNTHTDLTLDDLASLRWKCGSCDEWHTGPCLDFSYDAPIHWQKEYEAASFQSKTAQGRRYPETLLDEDHCVIEDKYFFVRGIIHLPIIGTAETLRWGVWGSLNRDNFETFLNTENDPKRVELPPMFSWLSTQIPEYPDTLNLKMYARIENVDWRPSFELEPTEHPLSREYHNGITPERVKEIMLERLKANE